MTIQRYQNLIIGSGEAGKFLAWQLAKQGQTSAVVERAWIGGSCPNIACLPSKNVIYSAKAVSLVHPVSGLGVVSGSMTVDMAGVARRKREMVDELIELHLANFRTSGAELIMGHARLIEPKTVRVERNDGRTQVLQGERVIVCVGTRASFPDVPGLAIAGPMTHIEALDLERLPSHLVVIGGGYVALEFAQALRRFGSQVTIVQRGPRLLEREDPEVSDALLQLMRDEGIEVLLQTELLSVEGLSGKSVRLHVKSAGVERTIAASDILVAVGRTPNTDTLDVERAGIELDSRGYVRVDDKLRTSADSVWAVGDCAGSPQFTHVAYDDFRVVMSDISGGNRTTRDRLVPYCLFTDPELAHVGMTESATRLANVPYRLARMPMSMVLRSRTLSQTRGFLKAIIGADDRILGFTAFGAEASEMMAVVQTAMIGGLPYTALRDAIFTHPTATEGLVSLFSNALTEPTNRTDWDELKRRARNG